MDPYLIVYAFAGVDAGAEADVAADVKADVEANVEAEFPSVRLGWCSRQVFLT